MVSMKSRQLLLSIAIISLMISATVIAQSASATTLSGTLSKSIKMTAGSDGRSFACVNGTWGVPSVQEVNYSDPFNLYSLAYDDTSPATTTAFTLHGPVYGTPSSSYNPTLYGSMATGFGPGFYVPNFLIAKNATDNIVSPTISLTCRDNISLSVGSESDIEVDATSPVVATMDVSSSAVGQLIALTGLVTGSGVDVTGYDPYGNSFTMAIPAGYYAYPMITEAAGTYAFYFTSSSSSYITLTPTSISATSMSLGQFSTGTMTIPTTLNLDALISGNKQPSQIVALSYAVTKGEQYAFAFTANEELTGVSGEPTASSYACYYFDLGTTGYGEARAGILGATGSGTLQPVVSEAVTSGTVYVVLVGNYISRFQYTMGVESATVPTAPLNALWQFALPTPTGMLSQLYTFSIPNESMVIMNYSNYVHPGTPIVATISKITSTGIVYSTTPADLGSGYLLTGYAQNNYQTAMYMSAGTYMLSLTTASATNPPSADLEINAYPIANITSGAPVSIGVGTTEAFAINLASAFQFNALNVSLTTELNASMFYRLSVFDNQNILRATYNANGVADPGIGNWLLHSGSWQGITGGPFYTYDSGASTRTFAGNKSAQIDQFVNTYAGRYFLLLSFLNGYNDSTPGTASNRWQYYENLAMTLDISVSAPPLASVNPVGAVYAIKYLSLDASSGSGSTSWTFTSAATASTGLLVLALNTDIDTWTRVSVSIINGSAGGVANGTRSGHSELIYDTLQYGINTFDYLNAMPLLPSLTYYMVHVNHSDGGTVDANYSVEFGAFTKQMMIAFLPLVNASTTSAHTVVSINVSSFPTPGISGLGLEKGATPVSSSPVLVAVVLVVVVVVIVALVVVFIVVRKKSGSRRS